MTALAGGQGRRPPEFRADDPLVHEKIRRIAKQRCPVWLRSKSDDIAQKASLRLLENSSKKDNARYCSTYLYRVVSSVIISEIRDVKKRGEQTSLSSTVSASQDVENAPALAPCPEASLQDQRRATLIRGCMNKLSKDRKIAVALSLQGYRASEIAQLLNWNLKRAENLICRGRSQLRNCLKQKGVFHGS